MSATHVAIIKPDARWRFNLAKFISRASSYRLYVDQDGRRVILEAVVDE